jgi:hypothetical protein
MMAVMFWMLRGSVGFAALASLMLSWRTSLVLLTCLGCDLFAMIGGTLPMAGFWTQGRLMFCTGVVLGSIAIGRAQEAIWPLAALAAGVLALLTASWFFNLEGARALSATWPLQLTRVLALPLGLWGSGEAVRAFLRAHARASTR